MKSIFSNKKLIIGLGFVIIALINLYIFYPSFYHIARSDQIVYLANTENSRQQIELLYKYYSYDRIPHLYNSSRGELLFRPLFFLFLGLERFCFEYNFMLWQITGFLLHLIVIWCFLKLLLQIRYGFSAFLLTLFFSALFISSEMVVWHHISSYMLFLACILLTLKYLYQISIQKTINRRQFWSIFILLLAANFLYEMGFIINLLFVAFLLVSNNVLQVETQTKLKKRLKLVLLAPAVIYVLLSALDFNYQNISIKTGTSFLDRFALGETLKGTFISICWWCYSGIFPKLLNVLTYQRTMITPQYLMEGKNLFKVSFGGTFNIVILSFLAVAFFILLIRSISLSLIKEKGKFILLICLMLFIQTFINVMGRGNVFGLIGILRHSSYYSYFFWIYFILLIYLLLADGSSKNRFLLLVKACAVIVLIMFTFNNARLTWQVNQARAKKDSIRRFIINDVNRMIKKEGNNFSFIEDPKLALVFDWIKKDPTDTTQYSLTQLLYPYYYNYFDPKYFYKFTPEGLKRGQRY